MSDIKVICGDNISVLKTFPDNYFDCIVTDAPYGLGKEPNAQQVMNDWIEKGHHDVVGSGFMGKCWDSFVPQPLFWKEAFRVLKCGGHALCFFGTRTYDWGVMSMRFAGFEIRDCITWHYSTGFPKSHNVSKAIDKAAGAEREIIAERDGTYADIRRDKETDVDSLHGGYAAINRERIKSYITAPSTDGAKEWEGWGTALKPASEPIVVARKPLEKGLTIAENILKYGTGGINIDCCRIDKKEGDRTEYGIDRELVKNNNSKSLGDFNLVSSYDGTQSRFPANVVFTHHPECECIGESWYCHANCSIRILDEQTGILKSGNGKIGVGNTGRKNKGIFNEGKGGVITSSYGDKGGASRFFLNTSFNEEEKGLFFYTAKASRSERNKGLDGFDKKNTRRDEGQPYGMNTSPVRPDGSERKPVAPSANHHPTVKPVALMRYLIKLVMPPNGIGLDPFAGSGTTAVAAEEENMNFVVIDQEQEYCDITNARVLSAKAKKPEGVQVKLF